MGSPSQAAHLDLALSNSRTAHRYERLDSAIEWVNSQTAGFCQDHQGPKEFHQPRSRVLTRFFFTLGVLLFSVTLVLTFLFVQETTFKTSRYWGASYALDHFTRYLSMQNASMDPAYETYTASMVCPCSNTAFSWTSFVEFFTIYYNLPQNPIRTSRITNGTEFCFKTMQNYPLNSSMISRMGCPNLLNSVVDSADARTILSSNSLMDPVLLEATIQRYAQYNLEKALNECVYYMSNETDWNVGVPFEWLRNTYEVFQAMLKLYGTNPHASDLDFWNTANRTVVTSISHVRLIEVIADKLAVGMQVDWVKYVQDCSPIYCDVVKETSLGSKFFAALAQIGGFGALMLIVIRKVVWPLICLLGRWKS